MSYSGIETIGLPRPDPMERRRICPVTIEGGIRCCNRVEVVLAAPGGGRYPMCRFCAEAAVAEYETKGRGILELQGWTIQPATDAEIGIEGIRK